MFEASSEGRDKGFTGATQESGRDMQGQEKGKAGGKDKGRAGGAGKGEGKGKAGDETGWRGKITVR